MKIFLHSSFNNRELIKVAYHKIIDILRKSGAVVISNYDEDGSADLTKSEIEQISRNGENVIDKMDGIIIDASIPDTEIGYLLAYAIVQKKPILYLHESHSGAQSTLGYFSGKKIPDSVCIKPYEINNLPEILEKFISEIETGESHNIPNIKFTLRITPQIERFLAQKAKLHKTTKADYLREEMIKKIMQEEVR
ncbi:MAG: hypothetical protein WC289_02355 [Patescibacteria group bacterium]|jgi:hypothetical protein